MRSEFPNKPHGEARRTAEGGGGWCWKKKSSLWPKIFQFRYYMLISWLNFLTNNIASSWPLIPEPSAQTTSSLWGRGEVICGCSVEPIPLIVLSLKMWIIDFHHVHTFPLLFFFVDSFTAKYGEPSGPKFQECEGNAEFDIKIPGFITKATSLSVFLLSLPTKFH